MSDDELVKRLQLLLHFSLSGNATAAQYQEVNDVSVCVNKEKIHPFIKVQINIVFFFMLVR